MINDEQTILNFERNAKILLKERDYLGAHKTLLKILQINEEYSEAFYLLALIPLNTGNPNKAIELLERAINLSPNNVKYSVTLVKSFAIKGDVKGTIESARKALELGVETALDYDTLGVAYSRIGLHEKALDLFKAATQDATADANSFFNLGSAYKFIGLFDDAKAAYKDALLLDPKHYKALASYVNLGKLTNPNYYVKKLKSLIETTTKPADLLQLSHALASIYESQDEYLLAFETLQNAKQKRTDELGYSFSEDKQMFDALHNIFSNDNIRYQRGFSSSEPIFVVGMPRTGTTLVERIVGNHQDVTSVGELHHFEISLKQMAGIDRNKLNIEQELVEATNVNFEQLGKMYTESVSRMFGKDSRFLDKLPLNVLFVGFIVKALSNCKIICLERNSLDTIVSNYRQIFSPQYAYCHYAYDLKSIAKYYLEYQSLVEFWLDLFPNNVLKVNYEELVKNPEQSSKNIFNFCDLAWQPDCLNIQNNTSPVATASATQVRQPMHTKYIGNWRKYETQLDEVKNILTRAKPT